MPAKSKSGGPTKTAREPLVSVVIPTYNRAELCSEAVRSVLAGSWRPVEVIVVDDGSTDQTEEAVAGLGDEVRCVRQQNAERGAARNRGVEAAKGEVVAFLDSDDLWTPDHLAVTVEAFERAPEAALVFGKADYIDAEGRALWPAPCPDVVPPGETVPLAKVVRSLALTGIPFPLSSVVLRQSALGALRFSEDRRMARSEDFELWSRIAARHPVAFTGRATTMLRIHEGNTSAEAAKAEEAIRLSYESVLADEAAGPILAGCRAEVLGSVELQLARIHLAAGNRRDAWRCIAEGRRVAGRALDRSAAARLALTLVMPAPGANALRRVKRALATRRSGRFV